MSIDLRAKTLNMNKDVKGKPTCAPPTGSNSKNKQKRVKLSLSLSVETSTPTGLILFNIIRYSFEWNCKEAGDKEK